MPFNYYFDYNQTFQKRLVEHEISGRKPLSLILFYLFFLLGILGLVLIILNYLEFLAISNFLLGISLILFVVFLNLLAINIFYSRERSNLEVDFTLDEAIQALQKGDNINLADLLGVNSARLFSRINKAPENINLSDLLKEMLSFEEINFIIRRMGAPKEKFKELAVEEPVDIKKIVFEGLRVAAAEKHELITLSDIFGALCLENESLKRLLFSLKIKEEDMLNIIYWQSQVFKKKKKRILDPESFVLNGGIGRDWAFGYTRHLNKFSRDVTAQVQSPNVELHRVGYDKEITELEKALVASGSHNAILVGEPGIGKTTIVYSFAKRVYSGATYGILANRHILELDISSVLAGAKTAGEISGRLHVILSEAAYAGNIILFINRIEELFSSGEGEVGRVDASSIILPYLESPSLFFIGTTTPGSYHKFIERDPALRNHFQKINVEEPEDLRVLRILEDVAPSIEYKTGVTFNYLALKEIIKLARRAYVNKTNPEMSIDLMDQTAVDASSKGIQVIKETDVQNTVEAKTGVEVGEVTEAEKSKLLNLEDYLHKRIVNQEEAVKAVADAMRRSRAEVEESKKPIGSFLFLGPTGVGKTETSKALSESYFGSEEKMIRFDMSEYQTKESISRLIGSESGSGGLLSERISQNPYTLVLFDEIEKAESGILNLFLQMLDEGYISDASGKRIVFSNTIIIATSNAGSEFIRQAVKSQKPYEDTKTELLELLQRENIFRPEFLNRFTSVVVFSPLSTEQTREVAKLMIERLRGRLEKEKEIKLDITEAAIAKLALKGYSPEFGARALQRTIQESLENVLAKKMISGEVKRGATVTIDKEDIE